MQLAVLGPVEVRRDGEALDVGGPKPRALLAALALAEGRAVPVDTLLDLLWGDSPTPGAMTSLQAYVSGLRKVLEPDRARRGSARVLVTVAPGYALRLPGDVDAAAFAAAVATAHRVVAGPLLGPPSASAAELDAVVADLDRAVGLWRGTPYVELGDAAVAEAERARLEELRLVAEEDRAAARLALGDHGTAAAQLEALTAAHPLRERLWALRALALVRAGRQADALEVLREVRDLLADELGLDPGPELADLQTRVLQQDPALAWSAPAAGSAPAPEAVEPLRAETADPVVPGQDWPMLGRDGELAGLRALLSRAVAGSPAFAGVTGEPGIGKSRLCAELTAEARRRGARVVVGRCSQDDGAPPLYPWAAVLADLGAALPSGGSAEAADFRLREEVVRTVLDATADGPLVVVLDDLHWADTATLRVLRLLVESATSEPVLVVGTWRDRPAPAGDLADVVEALVRRHADRIVLQGLDPGSTEAVVTAVTSRRPSAAEVSALQERTNGNPFFLVEYSRLVGRGDDLARVVDDPDPPTAVQEIVGRRLERLPDDSRRALLLGSVVGRQFELGVLAGAAEADEEELLDLLDPALAVGLLREDGVDRFSFDHALVRDTLVAQLSPSRRARLHARVAGALADLPGRRSEEARHWLDAGPAYADRAWRAARDAGDEAASLHAHVEADVLYAQALARWADDPAREEDDRFELLMRRADSLRRAADWTALTAVAHEALASARRIGDPELVARAAWSTTQGALWQPTRYGEVDEEIVAALRECLDVLPPGDSDARCRTLMVLACEAYHVLEPEQRRALVDEALPMAERIGDPLLLAHVRLIACIAAWEPATVHDRLSLASEAATTFEERDDLHSLVHALTHLAITASEAGDPRLMWEAHARASVLAAELRLTYAQFVLEGLAGPWLLMQGEVERAMQSFAAFESALALASLPHLEDGRMAAIVAVALWLHRFPMPVPELVKLSVGIPMPAGPALAMCLWVNGEEELARQSLARVGSDMRPRDWYSLFNWATGCAVGLMMDDPALAADAYARLLPYADGCVGAGSGVSSGPAHGYLAMAAAAMGEQEAAREHATAAEALAADWRIPVFAEWFTGIRRRYAF
ncbi:BTAD domain-containing putative transcriptional regulator [Nocardioides aestuarii]|uniref:BTAD domain-containing putative transcriptional regulator n=1 Tax=Nocardioides aestuarii TaxID=252231 RepID=A0ABW4TLJ3_9ACTN